jgi:apolipoprotein N-acyltransferase
MLLPFGQFQTIVPLAAWLAPIFLLRFSRTQRALIALPVLALVHYLAAVVSMRGGLIPGETLAFYALGGALGVLPYVADTALVRRVPGWARTLVFPAAAVVLDWAFGLTSWGTLGSLAYSQFGFASLTQLASVTGIWGIVFLIMWLAPVTNEVWERGFQWATLRSSVIPLTAVLLTALVLGGARLAFFNPTVPTVRVAALAADRALRDSDQQARVIEISWRGRASRRRLVHGSSVGRRPLQPSIRRTRPRSFAARESLRAKSVSTCSWA